MIAYGNFNDDIIFYFYIRLNIAYKIFTN